MLLGNLYNSYTDNWHWAFSSFRRISSLLCSNGSSFNNLKCALSTKSKSLKGKLPQGDNQQFLGKVPIAPYDGQKSQFLCYYTLVMSQRIHSRGACYLKPCPWWVLVHQTVTLKKAPCRGSWLGTLLSHKPNLDTTHMKKLLVQNSWLLLS